MVREVIPGGEQNGYEDSAVGLGGGRGGKGGVVADMSSLL